jgi:hypothetical protein
MQFLRTLPRASEQRNACRRSLTHGQDALSLSKGTKCPKGSRFQSLKVRLHYPAKSMLDEFARRVFDKFAPSKAAISAYLLDA